MMEVKKDQHQNPIVAHRLAAVQMRSPIRARRRHPGTAEGIHRLECLPPSEDNSRDVVSMTDAPSFTPLENRSMWSGGNTKLVLEAEKNYRLISGGEASADIAFDRLAGLGGKCDGLVVEWPPTKLAKAVSRQHDKHFANQA